MDFADFLAKRPPGSKDFVNDLVQWSFVYDRLEPSSPDVSLDCDSDSCDGIRYFECQGGSPSEVKVDQANFVFLHYRCRNCRKSLKHYATIISDLSTGQAYGNVFKVGEVPPFGPRTPARLQRLIQSDRDLFLKGRRAETQGLGIGAFAYYRRVVENQKNSLIDEIIKVARKTGGSAELIQELEDAKKEIQFSSSVERINAAMPPVLLINGYNPLTLLHQALSTGLHAHSDEQCLEAAADIREVLVAFAEKTGEALKSTAELDKAIARLSQAKSAP